MSTTLEFLNNQSEEVLNLLSARLTVPHNYGVVDSKLIIAASDVIIWLIRANDHYVASKLAINFISYYQFSNGVKLFTQRIFDNCKCYGKGLVELIKLNGSSLLKEALELLNVDECGNYNPNGKVTTIIKGVYGGPGFVLRDAILNVPVETRYIMDEFISTMEMLKKVSGTEEVTNNIVDMLFKPQYPRGIVPQPMNMGHMYHAPSSGGLHFSSPTYGAGVVSRSPVYRK